MAGKLTGLAASSQGSLAEVLHGATAASSDPEWVEAVIAAIERELIMDDAGRCCWSSEPAAFGFTPPGLRTARRAWNRGAERRWL